MQVDGMSSDSSVSNVLTALQRLDLRVERVAMGIVDVLISSPAESVVVQEAIEDAGYVVTAIESDGAFSGLFKPEVAHSLRSRLLRK